MVIERVCEYSRKGSIFRSCFEMIAEFYHAEFSRQFRLWKRERSSSYVTDEKDKNGRKGRVRKERNHFKTASKKHEKTNCVKSVFYFSRVDFCFLKVS